MPNLFYPPHAFVPSSVGLPQAGALAYFYDTGTSNPKNTYSDYALTIPNTNPVVADANGVWGPIYLSTDSNYRVTLKTSAGVLIYTQDDVPGPPLSAGDVGSVLYPKSAAETSAGVTPTNYGYIWDDVRRFGVTGDGVTDDTTAINNACKAGYYGQRVTFQPWMTCIITNLTLNATNANVPPAIIGNGATLKAKVGTTGVLLKFENVHSVWDSFTYSGLHVNAANRAYTAVEVHGGQHMASYSGFNVYGAAVGSGVAPDGCGLYVHSESGNGDYYNHFLRIRAGTDSSGGDPALGANAKYGFYEYGPGPTSYRNNGNLFELCYARENGAQGWYVDFAQNCHVNCSAELNLSYGLDIQHTAGMSWYGGYFEANKGTATLTFTGAFAGGETSGTLTTAWNAPTSSTQYSVTFSNGDVRTVTLTNQATTATWTGALSGAATATATITTVDLHVSNNAGGVWFQPDRIAVVVDGADNANWASGGMMFMGRGSNAPYHDYNGLFSVKSLKVRSTGIGIGNSSVPTNGINGLNSADFVLQVGASTKFKWNQSTGYMESVVGHTFDKAVVFSRATVTYSASMTPDASLGYFQEITATNGTAFTINAPTNPTAGQELAIVLRNTSGGALGAITTDATYHLTAAFPSPANGKNQTVKVYYNGTNWKEVSRTAADVAN